METKSIESNPYDYYTDTGGIEESYGEEYFYDSASATGDSYQLSDAAPELNLQDVRKWLESLLDDAKEQGVSASLQKEIQDKIHAASRSAILPPDTRQAELESIMASASTLEADMMVEVAEAAEQAALLEQKDQLKELIFESEKQLNNLNLSELEKQPIREQIIEARKALRDAKNEDRTIDSEKLFEAESLMESVKSSLEGLQSSEDAANLELLKTHETKLKELEAKFEDWSPQSKWGKQKQGELSAKVSALTEELMSTTSPARIKDIEKEIKDLTTDYETSCLMDSMKMMEETMGGGDSGFHPPTPLDLFF